MLVTVKTNKYCLEIHMSPDAPFSQILEELHSKFLDSAKFFGKAKMALAIFGQTLTYEQTAQILEMITELTQIEIICVLDYDEENEPYWRTLLEQAQERLIQPTWTDPQRISGKSSGSSVGIGPGSSGKCRTRSQSGVCR